MSLIVIPSLKNSTAGNEIEEIAVNINYITLIRPIPRNSERCGLWIQGVENAQTILMSQAKLIELIHEKTQLAAAVSFISEETSK